MTARDSGTPRDIGDPGTGLYYLRARYYDPSIGRFISKDPFAGIAMQPYSLQRYPYSQNNPSKFLDPSGLTPLDSGAPTSFTALPGVTAGNAPNTGTVGPFLANMSANSGDTGSCISFAFGQNPLFLATHRKGNFHRFYD